MRAEIVLFKILMVGLFLCILSCDDDPVVIPEPTPGNISINTLNASYGAVRGSEVSIEFTANAEDGISAVSATVDGVTQDFVVTGTTFTGTITFTIPGDAVLHTEYGVDVEVTDMEGDKATTTSKIVATALIQSNPTSYLFDRDGESTVSFLGQNDRLDQVEEIKAYLKTGDQGAALSAAILEDAYANTNDDGNGFFSFSASKQLKNKTFQPDLDDGFMSNLFAAAEAASTSGMPAANGVAGLITRENSGNTVLVDAHGREFTQFIEKGLMGTVMYNQIFNTYFTDERIGDDVENTALREGNNYTDMEHHWDEAFGYWNPPLDFTSNWPADRGSEDRFWSHYSNVVDPFLGTNDKLMNGFINGRTAIVNNDLVTKNSEIDNVSEQLEIVAAATAVHYINDVLAALNEGKTGEAFHVLSEAWTFVNAIKYNPNRRLSVEAIEDINESDFGADGNFWNVTVEGLNKAKNTLVLTYPELESSKDDL